MFPLKFESELLYLVKNIQSVLQILAKCRLIFHEVESTGNPVRLVISNDQTFYTKV